MKVIELSRGQVAIVDDEDFEALAQYRWFVSQGHSGFYAVRHVRQESGGWKIGKMHRIIMNAPKGATVDHINGNTLDNRRCNLRFATHGQNRANSKLNKNKTTAFKGVCREGKRYRAQITHHSEVIYLGLFDTPEKAHAAYCGAAMELHGNFARLN